MNERATGKPQPRRTAKSELRRVWRVFEYRRPVPARPRFTT
jgi:hypothetical protein